MPKCDECGWRGQEDDLIGVDDDGVVEGDDDYEEEASMSFCPDCGTLVEP